VKDRFEQAAQDKQAAQATTGSPTTPTRDGRVPAAGAHRY
jgi:hypothetical protein